MVINKVTRKFNKPTQIQRFLLLEARKYNLEVFLNACMLAPCCLAILLEKL